MKAGGNPIEVVEEGISSDRVIKGVVEILDVSLGAPQLLVGMPSSKLMEIHNGMLLAMQLSVGDGARQQAPGWCVRAQQRCGGCAFCRRKPTPG